jgi:hypothetical protein
VKGAAPQRPSRDLFCHAWSKDVTLKDTSWQMGTWLSSPAPSGPQPWVRLQLSPLLSIPVTYPVIFKLGLNKSLV